VTPPAATRLRRRLLAAAALVAAAAALAAGPGGLLERAELATVDGRFELRGERPPPGDVVVVGIDDVTFDELRMRFPFDRRVFARALRRIAADGPRVIVYDVQFTEASGDRPRDIAADNALILAARRAGNVVFSSTETDGRGGTNVFGGREGQRYARARVGNGLLPEGPAGVLRRVRYEIEGLKSLPVVAVERAGRRVDRAALGAEGAWIDFAGPAGHLRRVPFSRAVRGRFRPGTFRDRIVVIGATAPSLQDRHPVSWPGPEMPGPEIQANAIDTLLRGQPLRSVPAWLDALLAVALALLAPLASLRLRPAVALGLAAAAAAAYAAGVQLAFAGGWIVAAVAPLLGLAVGTAGAVAAHALAASVERARVRELFARFVPDAVVSELLDRSDGRPLRLGGVRLVCTVMFSDLRGFTAWAEQREPEVVLEVLNRYLSAMSDAVLDHGGTLVAYMGDGVMAVFGAPIASDDHADRALAAARAMLARLDEFNGWLRERGLGDGFEMGIGLNTGGVMSGNVGSERRLEYAAVGDTTNTAARLEALTKRTPHPLLLSGATYEALAAPPEDLVFVDDVELRGRQTRLPVWGLAGAEG